MIRLKAYCFTSGLLFALLQFGFLLTVQVNISSTYITYAVITMCWMAGALVGLRLERPGAGWLMALQVAAYYATLAAVEMLPFRHLVMGISAAGVFTAGLWAGRIFPVMFARLARADALFFHENNGFIAGSILFLAGFTMLGSGFLAAAPLAVGLAAAALYQRSAPLAP